MTKNTNYSSHHLLDYYVAGIYAQFFIYINVFNHYDVQFRKHFIISSLHMRNTEVHKS